MARLTVSGAPIRSALSRVPLVAMTILLLGAAIAAVLTLTTLTDTAGIQAGQSRLSQQALRLRIQAEQQEVASLGALPRLAEEANQLGLVPAGDAPMLIISSGVTTLIASPMAWEAQDRLTQLRLLAELAA